MEKLVIKLQNEAHDLAELHGNLGKFLKSPNYVNIANTQKVLLIKQFTGMTMYLEALESRIKDLTS